MTNYKSQYGSAEWIKNLLNAFGIFNGTIFEVGASSPSHYSNSICFIESNWQAILVERELSLFRQWAETSSNNIRLYNRSVGYYSQGLEDLLKATDAPNDLDVLFFDIDGGELQLLAGLLKYRPKIIQLEYDNTFPLSIDFVPTRIQHGAQASSLATYRLMTGKAYTYLNSFFHDHIFIANEYLHLASSIPQLSFGEDFFFKNAPQHIYSFYNVLLGQAENNGGGGIRFFASKVQILLDHLSIKNAIHYFHHLNLIFESFSQVVSNTRSSEYQKQYQYHLEQFRSRFQHLHVLNLPPE